jgi:hypothetical protein
MPAVTVPRVLRSEDQWGGLLLRQYLYFGTSKQVKLEPAIRGCGGEEAEVRPPDTDVSERRARYDNRAVLGAGCGCDDAVIQTVVGVRGGKDGALPHTLA